MDVFLPIAQVFVNPIEILLLSALVGVLSGLFGVGWGFLMTPFLIFLGVPPAYAVANEANNILATSVSGSTTHWLKNTLDYKMGFMIVIGGSIGTALGIYTFSYFKGIGKIDTVISLAYMYILAIIGTLMLVESLGEIDKAKKNINLDVIKGKTTAIVGESGSGKTLSALSILKLLPITNPCIPSKSIVNSIGTTPKVGSDLDLVALYFTFLIYLTN